jgi:serine/threonine-protein kinase
MSALPTDAQPPTRGLVAGKYQLNRLIGKGGMGSVWEGQHFKLGTKVAIKFIETEHAVSAEARSRFEKEAMAAATIQSKHAIQIFDHGVTDEGIPYIVMEMLVGESLERRVERLNRMSLQETARVLLQVCRALARAHERGIIHRDLKPDNVFIVRDADDGEEIAKVLDFGIAKMQGQPGNPGMTSSTKTGAVLGTPFYMSPEQARGLRNVDHRTDVWSLGVIAYRCVTGKLPFDGESVGDLLVKICTAPVPVPSQVVAGIPPGFDQWFMRTMEREPERRFPSVMEQANELCYIAGIAQPGQGGTPMSHQQTVGVAGAVQAGLITPNGMMRSGSGAGVYSSGQQVNAVQAASGFGHSPMTQPSVGSNPGSNPGIGSNPGYGSQPGGITNSPFTNDNIAGVPRKGGAGKIIGGIVGGAVVIGLLAGGAFLYGRREQKKEDQPIVATSTTPPPPASTALPDPKQPDPKTADTSTTKPGTDTTTAVTTADTSKKPITAPKPGTHPPVAAPKPNPAPAPAPAPAAPAPAPAPKQQPNKNDPGY